MYCIYKEGLEVPPTPRHTNVLKLSELREINIWTNIRHELTKANTWKKPCEAYFYVLHVVCIKEQKVILVQGPLWDTATTQASHVEFRILMQVYI